MRKPRDPSTSLRAGFDAELKVLADRARQLKDRRVRQLGELVIACGADASDAETLAGALLVMAETVDPARKESWRGRGAAFFQSKARKSARRAQRSANCTRAPDRSAPPA
ncbi:MAG: conjugal transfer protein TraD [Sphingomonas sp.]|jgi:hypothetical protein